MYWDILASDAAVELLAYIAPSARGKIEIFPHPK
jgi:hypothetical protein